MKRLPGLFNDSFDEVFKDPFFSRNMEYMKTDIREKDNTYILEVELPGYQKEDIHMELQNGYLSIQAAHHQLKEDKDDKGNLIRQERYSGTCKRSFYVGDNLMESDIHASFQNGELTITFPKEAPEKVEESRFIPIE